MKYFFLSNFVWCTSELKMVQAAAPETRFSSETRWQMLNNSLWRRFLQEKGKRSSVGNSEISRMSKNRVEVGWVHWTQSHAHINMCGHYTCVLNLDSGPFRRGFKNHLPQRIYTYARSHVFSLPWRARRHFRRTGGGVCFIVSEGGCAEHILTWMSLYMPYTI